MESLIIYPKTKAQANALKIIFKEMNLSFEKAAQKTSYNAEWVATMEKSVNDEKEGKVKAIKLEDLWK